MTNIDARPQEVNIDHYAGDTLTLHVKVDSLVTNGRMWRAQVRQRRDAQRIDAEFQVFETPTGADVALDSSDCQRLARRGKYTGFWDLQLSEADGSGPVTTLAQGALRIHPDVTRAQS